MVFWQIFALIFSSAAGFFLWRHQQATLKSEKGISTDVQQTEQIQGLQRRVAALEGVLSEMRTEIARALDGQETYQHRTDTNRGMLIGLLYARPDLAKILDRLLEGGEGEGADDAGF